MFRGGVGWCMRWFSGCVVSSDFCLSWDFCLSLGCVESEVCVQWEYLSFVV